MFAFIQRLLNVRRDERLPVLVADTLFFCVLTSLMLLRQLRQARWAER